MNFAEYQTWAITKRNKALTEREARLTWALGLVDEVIEVWETFYFGAEEPAVPLREFGDVTWYTAVLAESYQIYDLAVIYSQRGGLMGVSELLTAAKNAGELVKKHISHGHPMPLEILYRNLSFVMSVVFNLAAERGSSLEEVMTLNRDKLEGLYEGGFSEDGSRDRTMREN